MVNSDERIRKMRLIKTFFIAVELAFAGAMFISGFVVGGIFGVLLACLIAIDDRTEEVY